MMISKLMLLEQVSIRDKKIQMKKRNIPDDIIDKLLQSDPNNKGKTDSDKVGSYTDWIVNRYQRDRQFDSFDQLYNQLEQYDKGKHKLPDKQQQGINYFNSLNEFITFVNENQDKLAIAIEDFNVEHKDGYDIFYSKDFKIYVPHTQEQSIKIGSGTKWCTAQISNNMFDDYYKQGHLFYIFNKSKNQERYNLHLKINYYEIEFADDKDRHLTYKLFDIVKQDPTLISQIKKYYEQKNVTLNDMFRSFIQCQTVNDLVEWYKKNIDNYAYLYFETNEENIMRVFKSTMDAELIEYIPHPSNQIKIQQVKIHYQNSADLDDLISLFEGIDEELQLQIVTQYGEWIIDLMNIGIIPSEEVQLQQIKHIYDNSNIISILDTMNDNYISYSEQVQIQQIYVTQYQLNFINDPTKNTMLYQLSVDADDQIETLIGKGITITKDLQMQQVTNSDSGRQIYSILDDRIHPDEDILLQQVEVNPHQIVYILDKIEEGELDIDYDAFMLKQIIQDIYVLRYLPYVSEEVQLQQIRYDKDSYDYIQNPTQKQISLYNQMRLFEESISYINKLLDV